jgi:leader peptidase (prepilin peptidase)/N-methyltransferase
LRQASTVVEQEGTSALIISILLYALLGWLVGIIINHTADILPTRHTVWPRLKCTHCGTARPFLAWSAVLALLSRHTRCPQCDEPRHTQIRSLVVEVATPLLFVFLLQRYGYTFALFTTTLYTTILLLVTVTDLEHRLILNVVMLPSILLALLISFVDPNIAWQIALLGGVCGFGLSYVAALISRGGLGGGDVTLSTFLGLILGFPLILQSLILGVFLGGFTAFLLLITRRVGLRTYIPYGPFLTATGWIMLIWGDKLWIY